MNDIRPAQRFQLLPSLIKSDRLGELSLPERLASVFVASILTFFTSQLIDIALFGGRPAFSNMGFVYLNLGPLLFVGAVGAMTRRSWAIAILLTMAGLAFTFSVVGTSSGFAPRALAQYFQYGTLFLWNAMFYSVIGAAWLSAKEARD